MSDKEEEEEIVQQNERRRSTTVIMTNSNFIEQQKASSPPEGVRRTGSMRRRLSKQNATHEEPENSKNEQKPVIEEEEAENSESLGVRPSLQRVDAIVGDDDTKLRPPGLGQKHHAWSTSKSLSRESTGTDYSDRSGTDLRQFIRRTLHKSEEDRDQLIYFERIMRELVENPVEQSQKIDLPSSYHRMLFHRCAAWFGLDHNVTNKHTEIVINKSEKTKMPEDKFADLIINNDFMEGRFTRHSSQNSRRDPRDYGSQASLSHDLQRAQSFEQQNMPILPQHAPNLTQQMRQLSLQPQNYWATQRSFDHCSGYTPAAPQAAMRKAESYGNLEPPSVLVHHYHHCYEEPIPAAPQPVYHQFGANFYPGYTVQPAPPPPQTTVYYHPIPYGTPHHFIQPEFIMNNDTPPIPGHLNEQQQQQQPFPHVEHFQMVDQTENRRNFQKASVDAGYGSMNQEISETSSTSAKESDKS
ncbi:unnamed protein product [Caenorhabditis angaria]|uniref:R3H domain-containing protein n=1 Tax=Caenorhabditis angaria TaxID=860376 RepID=A0A9P1IJR5_9PELO|nr:unnamed protein product [Caenorhabditis angaria]